MKLEQYLNEGTIKSKLVNGVYAKQRVIEGYKDYKRLYVHKQGRNGYCVTSDSRISIDNMVEIGDQYWFGTLKELHDALNEN